MKDMTFSKLGRISAGLAILISFYSSTVLGTPYPDNLFAVNQIHFDTSRSPQNMDRYIQSRDSIGVHMGIDPRYVALATNGIPKVTAEGEETWYEFPVAEGYAYCSSRISIVSIVPASGPGASVVSASVEPKGFVGIYTWIPKLRAWEGKSWVEGYLEITGILPQYLQEFAQKGICAPISALVNLINCRGNPCSPGYHGASRDGEVARKEPRLVGGF